jgi:hypothetical protein
MIQTLFTVDAKTKKLLNYRITDPESENAIGIFALAHATLGHITKSEVLHVISV